MSRQPSWVRRALVIVPTACALVAPAVAARRYRSRRSPAHCRRRRRRTRSVAATYQMVPEDLSKSGYVEEEYLVSGLANV